MAKERFIMDGVTYVFEGDPRKAQEYYQQGRVLMQGLNRDNTFGLEIVDAKACMPDGSTIWARNHFGQQQVVIRAAPEAPKKEKKKVRKIVVEKRSNPVPFISVAETPDMDPMIGFIFPCSDQIGWEEPYRFLSPYYPVPLDVIGDSETGRWIATALDIEDVKYTKTYRWVEVELDMYSHLAETSSELIPGGQSKIEDELDYWATGIWVSESGPMTRQVWCREIFQKLRYEYSYENWIDGQIFRYTWPTPGSGYEESYRKRYYIEPGGDPWPLGASEPAEDVIWYKVWASGGGVVYDFRDSGQWILSGNYALLYGYGSLGISGFSHWDHQLGDLEISNNQTFAGTIYIDVNGQRFPIISSSTFYSGYYYSCVRLYMWGDDPISVYSFTHTPGGNPRARIYGMTWQDRNYMVEFPVMRTDDYLGTHEVRIGDAVYYGSASSDLRLFQLLIEETLEIEE